jgi:hypothetical protein
MHAVHDTPLLNSSTSSNVGAGTIDILADKWRGGDAEGRSMAAETY